MPWTKGIFFMSPETREPVELYMDACVTGCSTMYHPEDYHTVFLARILAAQYTICQLEVLNALVVVRQWVPQLRGRLMHLFSDSGTTVVICQAGKGRNHFI